MYCDDVLCVSVCVYTVKAEYTSVCRFFYFILLEEQIMIKDRVEDRWQVFPGVSHLKAEDKFSSFVKALWDKQKVTSEGHTEF